ncbi:polyhomeotic-like protein 2 isoform X2 [Cheilinus undulatus]|uniref:polyhomeotic-like protein 2 isoform X2 n=1 Tax=Cheilinus undulatus TaxID=241271 RepID=UPI001BD4FDEA|nr:polyhomeotic-like protein 2 isoform X2 [Cheilinus undulatus]
MDDSRNKLQDDADIRGVLQTLMMDRELLRPNQSEHGEATNGTSPPTTTDPSTPTTPTPPRLTPNPMLLDSAAPVLTPTTSSPPPPLTPAPSITATHIPKAASAPSPHILVPAPPKLTSTTTPALRTYSRPILPSPAGASKTSSPSTSSPFLPPSTSSSSPSSPVVASTTSPVLSSSSSATHSSTVMATKTSTSLTNGNTRPVSTSTATPIKPFHTPASPPGRQVSQAHPSGSPGLVRANQSPSPVRQRVSQQTLLLGKGLKGSGQDQVLLRAQMLQSLTLRPPPPGTIAIPPSLRLKPTSSAPPPLSRPQAPLFPPLRPRPQPSTTATESPTTPSRHLSVPPPTLYSPVRAVPLRPRLHSPNGHRSSSPRQSSALQPIAAAPSSQASSISRPLSGMKTCPLTQSMLGPSQSQHSSLSVTNPMSVSSHFERSPSAARQLQIIALSSGRQTGAYTHTVQSPPPVVESTELSSQSKRTLSGEDVLPLPLNPTLPKNTSPLPSPPSLLSPASPPGQPSPLTQTLNQKREAKDGEEQRERPRVGRQGIKEDGGVGKDLKGQRDDQREKEKEKPRLSPGKEASVSQKQVQEEERSREEEDMEVTEEGERDKEREERGKEKKREVEEERETPMDQSEDLISSVLQQQNTDPCPKTDNTVKDSNTEPKPVKGLISAPVPSSVPSPVPVSAPVPVSVPVQVPATLPSPSPSPSPSPVTVSAPVPSPVPAPAPVPEVSVHSQRLHESHRDVQPVGQEDFCENMSTQSDNQSALSSLSSQSPPSSPFITPSAEHPPPLLPVQTAHPTDLSLSQWEAEKVDKTVEVTQHLTEAETEPEPLCQSEDESDSFSQSMNSPWEPKAWPEGRQVLTHLVEGFVIQEGLQPFPVHRSSLLVPEQVTKPQEVNGTNGKAVSPASDTVKKAENSTESEEDEAGDMDSHGNRSTHRDRTVLHCQFCGKRGHAHNFMRSKRFCSTSCARGFNVRLTKRLRALSAGSRSERPRPVLNRAESVPGKPLLLRLPRDLWSAGRREKEGKEKAAAAEEEEEDDEDEDMEGGAEEEEEEEDGGEEDPAVAMAARMERRAARRARRASAPALTSSSSSTPTTTFKPAPSQWSVEEVTAFIHTLPGCGDVAEAFRLQEIDGQALLLLTEDHLMTSMNIKLGPALKICAHINSLKNQ